MIILQYLNLDTSQVHFCVEIYVFNSCVSFIMNKKVINLKYFSMSNHQHCDFTMFAYKILIYLDYALKTVMCQ